MIRREDTTEMLRQAQLENLVVNDGRRAENGSGSNGACYPTKGYIAKRKASKPSKPSKVR
jgi:hypothetical protein